MTASTARSQTQRTELYGCAIEAFHHKNYAAAIEYYTRVIALSPCDSMVYFDRAMACECLGDFSGRPAITFKQLAADSSNVDCYFYVELTITNWNNTQNAVNDFERTLGIESDNGDARYYCALSQGIGKPKCRARCLEAKKLNAAALQTKGLKFRFLISYF